MSGQTKVNKDPSRLMELPRSLEVQADDTLESFYQTPQLQALVNDSGRLDHLQLLLDRRRKVKPSLSKPLRYLHLSTSNQLLGLAAQGMVGTCLLALKDLPVNESKIVRTVDGVAELLQDAKHIVRVILDETERRQHNGEERAEEVR